MDDGYYDDPADAHPTVPTPPVLLLIPLNPPARKAVDHRKNSHLRYRVDDTIGLWLDFSDPEKKVRTLGNEDTDIHLPNTESSSRGSPHISPVHASFQLVAETGAVLLWDHSDNGTVEPLPHHHCFTVKFRPNAKSVLVARGINTRIAFGRDQWYRFEIQWQSDGLYQFRDDEPYTIGPRLSETKRYVLGGEIGAGTYSTVSWALDATNGKIIAVKKFHILSSKNLEFATRETANLFRINRDNSIKHEHILQILDCAGGGEGDDWGEIFMPLMNGNLKTLIEKVGIPDELALSDVVLRQMLLALECIASHGIIHRRVKPENILWQYDKSGAYRFCLGDFCLSTDPSLARTAAGTEPFMAPEVFHRQRQTTKVDIWSLFATIVWTRTPEFRRSCSQLRVPDVHTWLEQFAQMDAYANIRGMASMDPRKRPSATRQLAILDGGHDNYANISIFDEQQQADEIEIQSLLSDFLPSLTEGSTISSSLTPGLIEDIKSDTLTILTKDEDFRGLLNETPKRTTHERFQRNFLRLFRWFLSDIRKHSHEGGKIHQVIHVLRHQSRNIASHICQEIFDLKAQSDALSSLALQVPDKKGQLISFLGNASTTPEIVEVPKGEPYPDNNTSGGESDEPETVQPYPIPLNDIETIILGSTSFLEFREKYRAFLFPRSDPQPLERVTFFAPAGEAEDSQLHINSTILESLGGIIKFLLSFWDIGYVLYNVIDTFIAPVKQGYRRLRWRCSCGTLLCADFDNCHPEALQELLRELHHVPHVVETTYRNRKAYKTIYVNSTETMLRLSGETEKRNPTGPGAGRQEPAPRTPHVVPASLGTAALQHGSTTRVAPMYDSQRLGPGVHLSTLTSAVHPPPRMKQFFEVCINTGRHAVTLNEIDLDYVTSDRDLFQRIWDRYCHARGSVIRKIFLKPRDIHFVMFSVTQAYYNLAGIHGKPSEYPPQEEVDKQRYHYRCPKILMPANLFLHFLRHPRRGSRDGHLGDTWLQRLPKKLNDSILNEVRQSTRNPSAIAQPAQESEEDDIVFGWGVHILEGPNQAGLSLILTLGIVVAFSVSCLLVGLAKTQEQGFGVGQFLIAIVACGMTAIYFALEDR